MTLYNLGEAGAAWNVVAIGGFVAFLGSAALPVLARSRTHSARRKPLNAPTPCSSIDVVVPAYLEVGTVAAKIASLRAAFATYPGTARVIVVAGDAATAAAAADADVVIQSGRTGKATACNIGAENSGADIVVFTDANCEILPLEWPRLTANALRHFDLVSGRKGESGGVEQLFWRFEDALKKSNPRSETLAVAGEFIATPRATFVPIPAGAILDDFVLAAGYVNRGLSVGVESGIRTIEPAAAPSEQWERRVRIAHGLLAEAIPVASRLARYPVGRKFLLHKVYRVTVGCLGFWACILAATAVVPPAALLVVPSLAYANLVYRGVLRCPRWLAPVVAVVGMQFVPPVALTRAVKGRLGRAERSTQLWRKVAR